MRALVIGALAAALVLFLWGFLVWGLMPVDPFRAAPDEPALAAALSAALPATGVYLLPARGDGDAAFEAANAAARRGPVATVFFRREGVEPMSASVFALGYLHVFASALLAGLLLRLASPALRRFGARFAFVALFGVAAGVWSRLGDPIWWHLPWDFHLLSFASDLIGWTLAGVVLARFVRYREPERIRMAFA